MEVKDFVSEEGRKHEAQSIEALAGELMEKIKQNAAQQRFIPQADVWESDMLYKIFIYLPGIDKENINLEIKDDFLVVSGERQMEPVLKEEKLRLMESSYGYFQRRIKLNRKVDASSIRAKVENGILNIVIPKREAQDGTIQVKVA